MTITDDSEQIDFPIGRIIGGVILIIFLILLLIILFGSIYTINAGYRGIILTWGKPSEIAVGEGIHFKIPIAQSVVKMDVRT